MEEIEITQLFVLVGNGYLMHTGFGWLSHYRLPYCTCLNPASCYLNNIVAFAYRPSFVSGRQTATDREKHKNHQNTISREDANGAQTGCEK